MTIESGTVGPGGAIRLRGGEGEEFWTRFSGRRFYNEDILAVIGPCIHVHV